MSAANDGRDPQHRRGALTEGDLVARLPEGLPLAAARACAPGDRFVTFDDPGLGRIGLAVCYDGNFPETVRQLAWMGAEVVLQPTLTTTSDRDAELVMARANAIFNQLYVVSLNAGAPAGLGRSVIVDPEGIVRLLAGDSEELLTDVSTSTRWSECDGTEPPASRGCGSRSSVRGPSIELPMYGGTVQQPPR